MTLKKSPSAPAKASLVELFGTFSQAIGDIKKQIAPGVPVIPRLQASKRGKLTLSFLFPYAMPDTSALPRTATGADGLTVPVKYKDNTKKKTAFRFNPV